MRLLELAVENVRGICALPLQAEGRNLVIWGPNGCGKSGVVDALDFLLTGQISRLTGAGTEGVSLEEHGPHAGHELSQATVRARLLIQGDSQPIEVTISRNMASPRSLDCDEAVRPFVDRVLSVAKRGQYVLTRRELHRYVTSRAGERGEQVQRLLNISEVEEVRRALVNARRQLEDQISSLKKEVGRGRATIAATLGLPLYNGEAVLKRANELRVALGGQAIERLSSTTLKGALVPPAKPSSESRPIDRKAVERAIASLRPLMDPGDSAERLVTAQRNLLATVNQVREDAQMRRDLTVRQLIEMGVDLIDESGACPLCETPWPEDELRKHLERRLSQARLAADQQKTIDELSDSLVGPVQVAAANIQVLLAPARNLGIETKCQPLVTWQSKLNEFLTALESPVEEYERLSESEFAVMRLFAPPEAAATVGLVEDAVSSCCPETPPEWTAWDTLTTLESNAKVLESSEAYLARITAAEGKAGVLLECFEAARNEVLSKLYDEIKDRFVALYRQLHKDDEGTFDAKLEPAGAALKLAVDFYGLGQYPPQALHSEGHQDSMGLCLYLALAERLTAGLIDLVVLDDIVTSVDEGHRREICRVLATEFPDRQFLITTHDRSWAFSLRSEGVVAQRNLVEFFGWNVQTGPKWDNNLDTWLHIEQHIERNQIPDAASELRRASEQFFTLACESLLARVVCKPRANWELGDLLPPALERHGALVRTAKDAANSWDDRDRIQSLGVLEATAADVKRRSGADMWQVDASVHYNNWHNLSPADFRVVADAFHDLWNLFRCAQCEGMLHVVVSPESRVQEAVRCNCGGTSWNLKKRQSP